MINSLLGKMKYGDDNLKYCRYSVGGGMNGGHSSVKLAMDKAGKAYLETRSKEYHFSREVTIIYPVVADAFEQIKKLCFEYDMYAASKRKLSPHVVLDGDTATLDFDFSKGGFKVSDNQMLSARHLEGFRVIYNCLINCKAGEGIRTVEPQEMIFRVNGYSLIYHMKPAFDSKLDDVLSEKITASQYENKGVLLATSESINIGDAEQISDAQAGTVVYEANTGRIIALYEDCHFENPVYIAAEIDHHTTSAYELLQKMEGEYYVNLN